MPAQRTDASALERRPATLRDLRVVAARPTGRRGETTRSRGLDQAGSIADGRLRRVRELLLQHLLGVVGFTRRLLVAAIGGAVRHPLGGVLESLSASQWGMVTTAQAAAHGVPRLDLSRLCQSGHLERLAHGVYRDAGTPSEEFESLRAAWLAADPSHTAEQRLRDLSGGVVVMGASAASLHEVGDLPADRHEFSASVRHQTQRRSPLPEPTYRRRGRPSKLPATSRWSAPADEPPAVRDGQGS